MSGIVNLLKRFFICLLYSKRLVCQIYSSINSYMNFFKDHLNLSNNIYDNAKILKAAEIKKQQEVVDRNPTTKYYQTLAQNLQEQVQHLKRMLNEAQGTGDPAQGIPSQEEMTDQERRDRYDVGRMRDTTPQPTTTPRDPNIPPPFNGPGNFPRMPSNPFRPGTAEYERFRREWRLQNYHRDNPFNRQYGSKEWHAWEQGWQDKPPMRQNTPPGTPGTFNYGPPSPNM